MPSPEAGATTPAASPASTTSRPLSHVRSGLSGIGAPSRRMVSQLGEAERLRAGRATEPRSEKPLFIEPVPMLAVSPCGKTQE